jgi:chromate transporter
MNDADTTPPVRPTLRAALPVWLKIGLLSFGGPAGQIALMHQELVDRRRWITDRHFLHALNYCMLLPGPEAQQLSIYLGWLMHRTLGGVIAGTLFVLPGAALILATSFAYVYFGSLPWMAALFYGLKASVLALVAAALIRIGSRVLKKPLAWCIALGSFVGIFFLNIPFPLIILTALLVGAVAHHRSPATTASTEPLGTQRALPSWPRSALTAVIWLALWIAPLLACLALVGSRDVLTQQAVFFSKAALVTFGGAYSVLPYVAQQAVEVHGWLSAPQMMDGLALAETTPGPLILVLQFVGFMGAWNHPGTWSPATLAVIASVLTSWMTFMPGFLFIFLGAPYIEYTHGLASLATMMTAVTAAVLGVILNLSIWFGIHATYPEPGHLDLFPLLLGSGLLFAIQRWKLDALYVVAIGAITGLLIHTLGLV